VCAPPWRRAELYGEPRVKRTHGVHQHGRDPGRVQVVGRWSEAAEQGRKVGSKTEEHARNKRKYREAPCVHQTCIQRKQDDHLRDDKRGTAVRIRSALKRQGDDHGVSRADGHGKPNPAQYIGFRPACCKCSGPTNEDGPWRQIERW